MMSSEIINIIELVSIVIGGTLGILGAATETKNKAGRLTKWGKIALAGIIITNSFSFVHSYLKQRQASEDAFRAQERENEQLKTQVGYLDSILQKTDKSLSSQNLIQRKTDNLLSTLDTSANTLNSILNSNSNINSNVEENLKKQSGILAEQQKANQNIIRSLSPFLPFGISYSVKIDLSNLESKPLFVPTLSSVDNPLYHEKDKAFLKLKKLIDSIHRKRTNWMDTDIQGLFYIQTEGPNAVASRFIERRYSRSSKINEENEANLAYLITPEYEDFENLHFDNDIFLRLSGEDLSLLKNPDSANIGFKAKAIPKPSKNNRETPLTDYYEYGVYGIYFPLVHLLFIYSSTKSIIIEEDNGIYKSTEDLQGNYISLQVLGLPLSSELHSFEFSFPPEFARRVKLQQVNIGECKYKTIEGYSGPVLKVSNKIIL